MAKKKEKKRPTEKKGLHIRNKHQNRYDFTQLIATCPDLAQYVFVNEHNDRSINFSNPDAVKMLNKALLMHFYELSFWDIPPKYLCPSVPSRADYIHYIADLLANSNNNIIPTGLKIKALDIGVGANCVYPIIGNHEYGWQFVGSDIEKEALVAAENIVLQNKLNEKIMLRLQASPDAMFAGIIQEGETFDITVCNPPFHASLAEVELAAYRKWLKLGKSEASMPKPVLNFGGKNSEICCEGGESAFVRKMATQSADIPHKCLWFTTLISQKTTLPDLYQTLEKVKALEVHTIDMAQGQKTSRVVAWTFFSKKEQREWAKKWK